ncbi:hypothetical protein [Asticcacaulis taihuensis]|uniref:hypothetical protein n=1 Tax=Asticcacaulis taihuensis TaxID=260084 RepID=UPI0026EED369|nr:hypothetical protein [Asticcacaulis taihuensis]
MQPDLIPGLTPPSGAPEKSARGRPKGSKNKATGDLLKWISAQTGGLTPGQQLAALVMVTPKDIRAGKAARLADGKPVKGIPPVMLGYWYRRAQLMELFGWTEDKADGVMAKLQDMLLPYVHQKQGSVEPEPVDKRGQIIVDNTALGALGNPSQVPENEQEISFGPLPLTHGGSHIGTQTLKP